MFMLLITAAAYQLAACRSDQKPVSLIGPFAPERPMPIEGMDTATITFDYLNTWTEGSHFHVIGLANNMGVEWYQMWINLTILDASGQPLSVDGAPSVVIPVMSDAVPPRGRSSFYAVIPLHAIKGIPEGCTPSSAGVLKTAPGPILIPSEFSGIRILMGSDTTEEQKEIGWTMRITIENPLSLTAQNPVVVPLVFGKDDKLWFTQRLDPAADPPVVAMEPLGPMVPLSKARFGFKLMYKDLPAPLEQIGIKHVEAVAYDQLSGK
jgi:hypothetical protein